MVFRYHPVGGRHCLCGSHGVRAVLAAHNKWFAVFLSRYLIIVEDKKASNAF